MPNVKARINKKTGEVRCGLSDCNFLLMKGEVLQGKVEIKCRCGVINEIIAQPPVHKPEGPAKNGSYQEDRLNLNKKDIRSK